MLDTFFNLAAAIQGLNAVFESGVAILEGTLFFDIAGLPLVVLWLLGGALFFTVRMAFVNVRGVVHGVYVILGHYDDPEEAGEVNHFQALSTALSATVGLGNIAGVAIAIQLGGPGAAFWMTVVGLLGMSSKFVECTLGQRYRVVQPDGSVSGGPMHYLSQGLAEIGLKPLGQMLALLFAVMCIVGSLGGGNMFQANQAYVAIAGLFPALANYRELYGLLLAGLVGLVIVGGIRRIGQVASAILPAMATLYGVGALWILLLHAAEIPQALGQILHEAFRPAAVEGGFIGVMVQGIRRGVFSNEAGVGSAAIAHAAARTYEPVREGLVALLEPLIDTVLICNMTALVCIVTGAYALPPEVAQGVAVTKFAFSGDLPWFPGVLTLVVALFGFSTIISWFYYGERCWRYLWGPRTVPFYQGLFLGAVFLGVVADLRPVMTFSDMMMFAMALPNMLGGMLLSGQVAEDLSHYWQRLNRGQMPVYR